MGDTRHNPHCPCAALRRTSVPSLSLLHRAPGQRGEGSRCPEGRLGRPVCPRRHVEVTVGAFPLTCSGHPTDWRAGHSGGRANPQSPMGGGSTRLPTPILVGGGPTPPPGLSVFPRAPKEVLGQEFLWHLRCRRNFPLRFPPSFLVQPWRGAWHWAQLFSNLPESQTGRRHAPAGLHQFGAAVMLMEV